MSCDSLSTCKTCYTNFTLSLANDACTCSYPLVGHICYDFANSPMKGCIAAVTDSNLNEIICLKCSIIENYALINNECHCATGYFFN